MDDQLAALLQSIEARLGRLEAKAGLTNRENAAPAARTPASVPASERVVSARKPVTKPAARPEPAQPGNWLGVVAVLCFVLAGGFIVKLAVASGWLTPVRQIGLAALLGFVLIGAGLALRRADRAYAGYLPGAGLIVLYLAVFASHAVYPILSFEASLAATACVGAIGVWLYAALRHDLYAITAAAGCYVAPVILDMGGGDRFRLDYILICSLSFAVLSPWLRSRLLIIVSAYCAVLSIAVIGLDMHDDATVAAMLGVQFVIFALGTLAYSLIERRPLSRDEATALFPVLLLFYATEFYYLQRVSADWAPWISLGFAVLLIALYEAGRRFLRTTLASQSVVITFATIVAFHSIYIQLLPETARLWLLPPILLGAALYPPRLAASARTGSPWQAPLLALLIVAAADYGLIFNDLLFNDSGNGTMPCALASLGALWVLIVRGKSQSALRMDEVLLAAAHAMAVVAFYRLGHAYGSLAVSGLWLVYALAVIAAGFATRDRAMAKSALFVLGFAAAKALLYDAASTPTGVRIVCLLLTGAVLYGCGFLLRRIEAWRTDDASVERPGWTEISG